MYFCVCVYLCRHILFSISDLFLLVHQLELDGKVGCVHLLLSPDQVTHLTDLLAALCIDTGTLIDSSCPEWMQMLDQNQTLPIPMLYM